MKILVVDRETIERGLDLKGRYIVISLHDSDARPAKVNAQPGLLAVLPMAIDDIDPSLLKVPSTSIAMTAQHATAIWDFVLSHRREVETIVVHCNAGYCRSPAVAAGLAKVLTGHDRRFFRGKDPNMHVYGMMVRVGKERKQNGL